MRFIVLIANSQQQPKPKRVHPWDKSSNSLRLITRRKSVFGTILYESEQPTYSMSYVTTGRRSRFISKNANQSSAESRLIAQAKIVELDSRGESFHDGGSVQSGMVSVSSDSKYFVPEGFPTSIGQKRKIMQRFPDTTLHAIPPLDLYTILRGRYDPDHSENPMDPLYSFSALCRRESLLFHPDVRSTLDEIWFITDADRSGSIDFKEYEMMHECMSIAVYGPNYLKKSEKVRRKLCLQDWNLDRQGEGELDYQRFTMCWFQLADQFTERIRAQDYVRYLRDMFFKMVERDEKGKPKWKSLKVIAGLEQSKQESYTLHSSGNTTSGGGGGKQDEIKRSASPKGCGGRAESPAHGDDTGRRGSSSGLIGFGGAAPLTAKQKIEEEIKREEQKKLQAKLESGMMTIIEVESFRESTERESMMEEELHAGMVQAQLAMIFEDSGIADPDGVLAGGGNMFDDIMNKFVDRNAFSRQAKFAGGADGNRRRSSIFREGHLGMDATEYEKIRMKLEAIAAATNSPLNFGEKRELLGKVSPSNNDDTDSDEYDDAFEVKRDDVSELGRSVKEEGSVTSMTSGERREERVREVAEETGMFEKEVLSKEVEQERRVVEEAKIEEMQQEIRKIQQEAYQEAIERKHKEVEEKRKKIIEAEEKMVKNHEQSLEDAVEKEKRAYERRERKKLEKKRRKRPMKGHIMVFGQEVKNKGGRERLPHREIDGCVSERASREQHP